MNFSKFLNYLFQTEMENRTNICICYVLSAFLITLFVYSLVSTHFSSITKVERLQFEVEEITKAILGRNPDEALLPQIDSYVKKRTQGLWDELVSVKRKIGLIESFSNGGCGFSKKKTELEVINQEEPNYALESIGATVVHVDDEPYHTIGFLENLLGIKYKSNYPAKVLDPSMQPGNCYAFKGDKSVFTIKLSHKIYIRAITVEHISASISLTGDISNAPKDIIVYGVEDLKTGTDVLLGSFQYNNSMVRRAQTFHLVNENSYQFCKIRVWSNYGNLKQTCIYRIAVHGKIE